MENRSKHRKGPFISVFNNVSLSPWIDVSPLLSLTIMQAGRIPSALLVQLVPDLLYQPLPTPGRTVD